MMSDEDEIESIIIRSGSDASLQEEGDMPEKIFSDTPITEEDGVLSGPVRTPYNEHLHAETSIHHNETAQKLGLRGGTIAGSYHMEQFLPLCVEVFGRRWFETGGMSMYFRYATTHLEPVQAFLRRPQAADNVQAEVWMKDAKDILVSDGTVSMGQPKELSALRQRLRSLPPPGQVRILKDLSAGMDVPPVKVTESSSRTRDRFLRITEPLEWYIESSPWGGPLMTPVQIIDAGRRCMMDYEAGTETRGGSVGLFGALEFTYTAGPLFCDREYVNRGKILAVGETPKTEYYWLDGILEEPENGREIARSLVMIRVMKASSELYPELR